MNYRYILTKLAKFLKLKVEFELLTRPYGAEYWSYNPNGTFVHQVYVTTWKKDKSASFGFWKYDEDLNKACKKALLYLIPSLIWEYKLRIRKWLGLK